MSNASDPFAIKDDTWPVLVIVAYAIGAFIVAIVIGVIIFLYYYKRHVEVRWPSLLFNIN